MKPTPGPWSIDGKFIVADEVKNRRFGYPLAEIVISESVPEGQANARLIAASPDMLQALKAVDGFNERGIAKGTPRIAPTFANMIKQAIAKATEGTK